VRQRRRERMVIIRGGDTWNKCIHVKREEEREEDLKKIKKIKR
jgi:hypothetical protein